MVPLWPRRKGGSAGVGEKRTFVGCLKWLFGNKIRNAQVAITVMLGLVLVPMVLAIWFYTSGHEFKQVAELALPLRDQLLQRTAARLQVMLESLHLAILTAAVTLLSDLVTDTSVRSEDLWSDNQVLMALWSTKVAYPFLQSVVFIREDGDVTIVMDVLGNPYAGVLNITKNGGPPFNIFARIVNVSTGVPCGAVVIMPQHSDARANLPYLSVINKPNFGSSFADFPFISDTLMGLSMRIKGGGRDGLKLNGMVGGSLTTKGLSDFIGDLDLLEGYMYIMNTDGLVIAATPGVSITMSSPTMHAPAFLRATQVNHTVISAIGYHLEKTTSIQALLDNDLHTSNIKVKGKRYYVDTTAVKWETSSWVVVIIVPRKSILGAVDEGHKNLAMFLSVLTAGTIIASQLLVMLLTNYMDRAASLKMELNKEQASKELAQSCSAIARIFLDNLSQDLRVPMSATMLALEVVRTSGLTNEDRNLLEQAQSSSSSLQSLVSSILDIAETERGNLRLNTSPLDLFNELLYLIDLFSIETASMGVDVLLELPSNLPLVMADKKRLHQIFINLLSNCVKFTSKGHVVIRGTVQSKLLDVQEGKADKRQSQWKGSRPDGTGTDASENGTTEGRVSQSGPFVLRLGQQCSSSLGNSQKICIRFNVEDTGKEIPPDHKELLFENFVSSPDNSSRYGGTGVGLGIVRLLVRLMGDDITAVDREGCGAAFSFTLGFPLALDMPMSSSPTQKVPELAPGRYEGLVLLAFQRGMQRDITASWLSHHGLTVHPQEPSWQEIPAAVKRILGSLQQQDEQSIKLPHPAEAVGEAGAMGFGLQGTAQRRAPLSADTDPTSFENAPTTLAPLRPIVIIDTGLISLPEEEYFTTTQVTTFMESLRKDAANGGNSTQKHQHPVVVVWAHQSSMSAECKATLSSAGCYMVQKPVVSSRLASLMEEIFSSSPTCNPPRPTGTSSTASTAKGVLETTVVD